MEEERLSAGARQRGKILDKAERHGKHVVMSNGLVRLTIPRHDPCRRLDPARPPTSSITTFFSAVTVGEYPPADAIC